MYTYNTFILLHVSDNLNYLRNCVLGFKRVWKTAVHLIMLFCEMVLNFYVNIFVKLLALLVC